MATYADFIARLRADVNDFPVRRFESADGDGGTTLFNLQHPKVLEGSLAVKINNVLQNPSTYQLDANVAQLVFNDGSAPASGNDNVSFEYKSVNETNSDWVDIINQALQHWRKKLWIEFVNESALTSVADQVDYNLSGIGNDIVHILNVEIKASSDTDWVDLRSITNVVFYKDLQKLHIRPSLKVTGNPIRIRGNRAYVQGNSTSSTFEPQEKYWPAIRELCKSIYLERQALALQNEVTALSKEKTFEGMNNMLRYALSVRSNAENMLKMVRPPVPAIAIPNLISGANA